MLTRISEPVQFMVIKISGLKANIKNKLMGNIHGRVEWGIHQSVRGAW